MDRCDFYFYGILVGAISMTLLFSEYVATSLSIFVFCTLVGYLIDVREKNKEKEKNT